MTAFCFAVQFRICRTSKTEWASGFSQYTSSPRLTPDRGDGVRMVGRGHDDRVEILLIEHLPIVGIFLGERKLVGRFAQAMLVDIA